MMIRIGQLNCSDNACSDVVAMWVKAAPSANRSNFRRPLRSIRSVLVLRQHCRPRLTWSSAKSHRQTDRRVVKTAVKTHKHIFGGRFEVASSGEEIVARLSWIHLVNGGQSLSRDRAPRIHRIRSICIGRLFCSNKRQTRTSISLYTRTIPRIHCFNCVQHLQPSACY